MNKKLLVFTLLFVTLFIFSVGFALSTSMDIWASCPGVVGGGGDNRIDCWVEGKDWLRQDDRSLDEDEDGNISLELRITNRYDYDLNNATLGIEKCFSESKFDNIKSGGIVHVKIGDLCVYEYYDISEGNFFWSNSSFSYFDENNTLNSRKGQLRVPAITKTEFEMRKAESETVRIESTGDEVGDSLSNEIMKHMLLRSFIIVAGSLIILLLIILLLGSKRFKKKQK
ncbi:MAG: hypothetical protein Q8O30_01345 [Candidatus Omnitrophota bacterium]|nr:hypothetical protein [Candidatus Omnitrophota bacterium]